MSRVCPECNADTNNENHLPSCSHRAVGCPVCDSALTKSVHQGDGIAYVTQQCTHCTYNIEYTEPSSNP